MTSVTNRKLFSVIVMSRHVYKRHTVQLGIDRQ